MKHKYIGLVFDEYGNVSVGYRATSDLTQLQKWKKEMLECSDVSDCIIYKIEEIQ